MTFERLMVAFHGTSLPQEAADWLATRPVAGVTLFYAHNVESPAQVRELTSALQAAAAPSGRPLLVATDQEGGQLIALGAQTTQFPGSMALGAAGDPELAERVGAATGRELRAMGVNVNYAPVCDLATEPANPAIGIRSFGDDPTAVGELAAATVRGLMSEGVAATVKHFPGSGDTVADPHHELPTVRVDRATLESRELEPFRAAIEAGAQLVMAGHFALPSVTGDPCLPTSLSRAVITGLLRDELGFNGLALTDALDMRALAQGRALVENARTAIRAGEDLLLGTPEPGQLSRLTEAVADLEPDPSLETQLSRLRHWLAAFEQPPIDVVGCADHQALAAEVARRSITLVRDDAGLLPLRPESRVLVVHSQPADLTPADTSSTVAPALAEALRRRLPSVDELITPAQPTEADIAAVRSRVESADIVVVGTFAANLQPVQAALANAVLDAGRPTVTVALRTPWDLATYPRARTHLCTYGILPPTIEALAGQVCGEMALSGRLPVRA